MRHGDTMSNHQFHMVQMSAARLVAPRTMIVEQVLADGPSKGQVRVRLSGCGICASNIPSWQGRDWFTYPMAPGWLGHEGWGVIDATGSEVKGLRVGDYVTLLSSNAYAEYDIAPARNVVLLPGELQDKPFPGEPLGCAMNIFRRSGIRSGQIVAIVGVGFLGSVLTQLAVNNGAEVIAISRRRFSREVARRMGARHALEMSDHNAIIESVRNITPNLCDVVIECAGEQWPLDIAGELCRVRGRLVVAGYHQDSPRQVNMQMWNWRGIDVINAHERDPRRYMRGIRQAVSAVVQGQLDPCSLFTHHWRLKQLPRAMEMMEHRPDGFVKGVIIMPPMERT